MIKNCFLLIATVILSACNSNAGPVEATTPLPSGLIPLPEEPRKFGAINLGFVDTNSAEWKETTARLDSFYKTQVARGFNGGVLIGYQGKILYERYFGFANKEIGTKWNKFSSSQLASTSKTMTAAAVLYLNEHKYLNINDPVSQYIDSFPYKDITIKMLMNHRSGLPEYLQKRNWFKWTSKEFMTNDDLVALIIKNKPAQVFKTNTAFKYCNTNYALLASIVEKVTEMPFKNFMAKYIFEPLRMDDTYIRDPRQPTPAQTTTNYSASWARIAMEPEDGVYGDKGVFSTTRDLYKWDQSFYHNYLLDNETIELAYGPCSFEKPGIKNYGLGWRMLCYPDGYKVIFHNGNWRGNNTCFYRFVKDNFTIIVLGNKYNSNIYRQPPVLYGIVKNLDSVEQFDELE